MSAGAAPPRKAISSMTRLKIWGLAAGAVFLLGASEDATPKPHALCEPSHREPGTHLVIVDCFFRGFGHYEVDAVATIRGGKAGESASFSIVDDRRVCSPPGAQTPLSDHATLHATCADVKAWDREAFSLVVDDAGDHRILTKVKIKKIPKPGAPTQP